MSAFKLPTFAQLGAQAVNGSSVQPRSAAVRGVRVMPPQKPGSSKQDYGTPREFLAAVERRFGPLVHDLAAHAANHVTPTYYSPEQDSLAQAWARDFPDGNLWLNCPFGDCRPWARKCAEESRRRRGLILSLTPAAVGTNWFADHVHKQALVLALSPRLHFVGQKDAYIKDLILSVYGEGITPGFDTWRWDQEEQCSQPAATDTATETAASHSRPSAIKLPPFPSSKSSYLNGSRAG